MSNIGRSSANWYCSLSESKRFFLRRFGEGEQLLIALHGFGEEGTAFAKMPKSLTERYTIIAIDLPFHGQTEWDGSSYTPSDIVECIRYILKTLQVDRFACIAHSLGGRIGIACLPALKSQLTQLYLLAPDGVDNTYSFWTNTIPIFLRKGIGQLVKRPKYLLYWSKQLYHWKLLDRFAYLYLKHHLGTANNRQRLIQTWVSLKHFSSSRQWIAKELRDLETPILIFLGSRDQLNNGTFSYSLAKQIKNLKVIELKAGHALIQPTFQWMEAN